MICLICNGAISFGPASITDSALRQALYVAGYTERGDIDGMHLLDPDGVGLPGLPAEEPATAIDLGHGYAILPVAEVVEPAPEGKMWAGREPVILTDCVEMRPVWADIPPPPAPPSLEEFKAAKQTEIRDKADEILLPLVTEYPVSERSTWETQQAEALSLLADPASDAPLLRAMAAERGTAPDYLAGRVLYHAARWKAAAGPVIGQRQKYQDLLNAARDVEAVTAITVQYTLPEA